MRIDPELCRRILIAIEGDENAGSGRLLKIVVDGYEERTIAHHVKYLWDEKLITGDEMTNLSSPYAEIAVKDITPVGRRFLDQSESEAPRRKIGF